MKIQALIVDDETLARSRLRKLLAQESDVQIIGECANGPDAIAFIREQRPDLVFLDVQMPEVGGFDVLRALPPDSWPAVIFVTAHDRHAIEAFDVHAVDYLLKPCARARLHEAVRRAAQHLQAREVAGINQQLADWLKAPKAGPAVLNRIAVKTGERTIFVKVEDIDYFESAGNYVVLHVRAENHVLRDTLNNLESKLPPRLFARISRSIIVSLDRIKELQPGVEGEHVIVLRDNRQLIMTRGLKEVQERLQYS
jgi:two-component system LytT family response regulator